MTMAMSLMMKNTTSALHGSSVFFPQELLLIALSLVSVCSFVSHSFFLTVLLYWKLTQSKPKIE